MSSVSNAQLVAACKADLKKMASVVSGPQKLTQTQFDANLSPTVKANGCSTLIKVGQAIGLNTIAEAKAYL